MAVTSNHENGIAIRIGMTDLNICNQLRNLGVNIGVEKSLQLIEINTYITSATKKHGRSPTNHTLKIKQTSLHEKVYKISM